MGEGQSGGSLGWSQARCGQEGLVVEKGRVMCR